MYLIAQEQNEDLNKGKAKKISFAIHLALLLLLLIPIIRPDKGPKDFERSITIDFNEPEPPKDFADASSDKKSGSSAAALEEAAAPREKVEVQKVEQQQMQKQVQMKVPERKEIITAPTPEFTVPEVKETNSEVTNDPIEEVEIVEEVPDALPVPDPVPVVKEPVKEPVKEVTKEESKPVVDKSWADGISKGSGNGTSDKPSKGKSSTGIPGLGDGTGDTSGQGTGKGNKGKDTGVGNEGLGDFWGDGGGDGMLTRPIVFRANAARLAIEKGTAVFSICVNRKGDVVWVEYDSERSTISDASMIAPLEALMEEYKFEQDYSAPLQQCGKWTIKVDK